MDALFLQRLQGLSTAVVELTSLAYLQCATTEKEDLLDRGER